MEVERNNADNETISKVNEVGSDTVNALEDDKTRNNQEGGKAEKEVKEEKAHEEGDSQTDTVDESRQQDDGTKDHSLPEVKVLEDIKSLTVEGNRIYIFEVFGRTSQCNKTFEKIITIFTITFPQTGFFILENGAFLHNSCNCILHFKGFQSI